VLDSAYSTPYIRTIISCDQTITKSEIEILVNSKNINPNLAKDTNLVIYEVVEPFYPIEKQFNITNKFQTSTRGLKIRGSYPTIEEAELRCKMLREIDPNHDIMVGPIGMWMPWDPEAYKTGRVEYMEEELNQLMHEKSKNESNAKQSFEQRIKETKQKAIEENVKNAEKSGNTLTQTIDDNGNLIGINNVNTQEVELKDKENISTADICMELFEGENIIIGNTDHGQSELLSGPFAKKN
jgi:hypothetical protein